MQYKLTQHMQSVVLAGKMPAREVAVALGKPYSTLMRELNPYDAGAKLGAETLLDIMRITGDLSALELISRELGCCVAVRLGEDAARRQRAPQPPAWA